jgi:alpha-mannosidase
VKKIFIVPYCHPDWAWTWPRRWHEKRYTLVFEEVLDILKKHPEYRWYFDIYKTELEPFLKRRPERVEELRKRIYEGKIAICGTYTNLRPSMTGEETQVRDILIGRKKYRELFPKADFSVYASTVDVSLGHPQMPQILTKSGYKYYRFMRPHAALSEKNIPLEFHWKGHDGSRILCSRGCYAGICYAENLKENFLKELATDKDLSPTEIRWLSMGTDDTRPLKTPYDDKEIPVFEFIKKWKRKSRIPLGFATPVEYFKEIKKKVIPEIAGSLDPCEVCYNVGWGGSNGLFSLRQENEINLTELEKWTAIASIAGFRGESAQIRELWEKHLLTCAHATQWLFEEDFDEIMNEALYVKHTCKILKKTALSFLAGKISAGKNAEFVIFNPLFREREEKVLLDLTFPITNKNFRITDAREKKIPFQLMDRNREIGKRIFEYRVMAKIKLPAGGYNTISISKETTSKKVTTKVPFSVIMRDAEIIGVSAFGERYKSLPQNSFGRIRLYRVDTTKGQLHVGPITGTEDIKWDFLKKTDDGEIFARYVSHGKVGKHEIERTVFIYRDEPRIEFQTMVDWKKEGGFLTLEFPRIFEGKIYGDHPFGVEEKDMGREPFNKSFIERQRKNLFFAKSFINYTDAKKSISYINYDASHYYLLTENSIANILINSITKTSGWERFVNRTMMAEGRHRFTSHLIFHQGDWRRYNIPAQAERFIRPVEIQHIDSKGKNSLTPQFSFISVSPSNLITTAFYRQGNDYILRFYEAEGRETTTHIQFFQMVKKVVKTDIINNKIGDIVPDGKNVRLKVKPSEIVTLRIHF